MADTVAAMRDDGVQVLAVASRGLPKAQAFAAAHGVPRAYGSYEAMLADKDIHLVYIATPHSHHAAHTELCLAAGRHVLCEKAFTVNEAQARRVTAMAREKGLLLAEAIWTRYMPSRRLISGIIESGGLGRVHSLQANLGYPIWEVERMRSPQLAGGTLLDLGVYPINFALMAFGDGAVDITGEARLLDTGVDAVENITMRWPDGRQACLHATMMGPADRSGFIYGERAICSCRTSIIPKSWRYTMLGTALCAACPCRSRYPAMNTKCWPASALLNRACASARKCRMRPVAM